MMKKLVWMLALSGALPILAQSPSKKDEKIEKLYDNKGYGKYLEERDKTQKGDMSTEILIKVADSYRKIGNTSNSEQLYQRIIAQRPNEPIFLLYYAQALQGNGKYNEAQKYYLQYDAAAQAKANGAAYDQRGRVMAQACARILTFRAQGEINLQNESAINGNRLDFSPTYYQNGVVFVSTRGRQSSDRMDRWINDNFMDLYFAEKQADGTLGQPRIFSKELNTKFHEGPVTFSENQQRIYFTRNNYNRGKRGRSKDKVTKLKIYSARVINNRWVDVREFPYNDDDRDVCHPTLSRDEQTLIFAMDAPDGFGGMDLYASRWTGNRWTKPVNLGAEINTAGNELFPYLHPNGTLYYSSDGWGGLGRLDVFMANPLIADTSAYVQWAGAINIGAPFNSQFDDFGFIINPEENEGYLTSNRQGGKGSDDIYKFNIKGKLNDVAPAPLVQKLLCVYDKATGKRIEGAEVVLTPIDPNNPLGLTPENTAAQPNFANNSGKITLTLTPTRQGSNDYLIRFEGGNIFTPQNTAIEPQKTGYKTDANGVLKQTIRLRQPYRITVKKRGYAIAEDVLTLLNLDEIQEYCIPLSSEGSLANNNGNPNRPKNATPTPNTDELRGKYPNSPFLAGVVTNKEYNRPLPTASVTLFNRCTGEEIALEVNSDGTFDYALECGCDYVLKAKKDKFSTVSKVLNLSQTEECDKPMEQTLALTPGFDRLGNPTTTNTFDFDNIQEGDVIELRNIFYDYDQYYIRPDATKDLDDLVKLLRAFPNMEIELSSHTDARGTHTYNETLSSNRAKAAREYLIQKGIDGRRVRAVGFGENRPRNNCRDNVPCSEYEHQRNRRTEVFVTRFDRSDFVKIRYEDNTPSVVDPKR